MSVPCFAFVKYHDGAKAIVHVSLIKKYSPTSVSELAKNKLVYWCSSVSLTEHGHENDEDYYPADVVELGVTKADLIQRLSKRKISVPEFIFDGEPSTAGGSSTNVPSAKRACKSAPPQKRRKPLGSHEASEVMSSEEDDDDGDDVVPKQLLLEEKKKNALLCKKLAVLRKEKEELQERHDRLEDNLLNRLESWLTARCHHCCKPHELNKENSAPPTCVMPADMGCAPAAQEDCPTTQSRENLESASILPVDQPCHDMGSQEPHNEVVELLAEVNGRIHLGNGVFIDTEKWDMLLSRDRDSLFCKEVTRLVWGSAALRGRSVTGALCRRFLKDGNAIEKPALSPHKLEAVGNAFDAYLTKAGPCPEERKVLVVCNPANTIAWVCSKYAPSIPKENFSALTRLDHNRAMVQIAQKLKVTTADVRKVIIWGNHSSTQFPDVSHASVTIKGQTVKVTDAIKDEAYFQGEFMTTVQERGTEIFNARKVTSAMSAAKAAADHVRDWWQGTTEGEWVSMAVMSDGSYGSPADVVFSYPVHVDAQRRWHIVQGLSLSDYARHMIDVSGKELMDERNEALAVCED